MKKVLDMENFEELKQSEMMEIDGGFTWRGFTGAVAAGGVSGGLAGAAVGGVGAVPGAAIGALTGGIAYCIADIIGE